MRCAVIADIHSNPEALTAVLDDIEGQDSIDEIWCLGDIVGYGPDPCACIEIVRQRGIRCVAGNHDWAAIGKLDVEDFNSDAAAANLWTGRQLRPDDVDYLSELPVVITVGEFTLVHGSPRDPIWEYVVSEYGALISFNYFETKFCLIGHSHMPLAFERIGSNGECQCYQLSTQTPLSLRENRLIVNPGSVGQPRDGDPRASYIICDLSEGVVWHRRVSYDVVATQERMEQQGLPPRLASRLSHGL